MLLGAIEDMQVTSVRPWASMTFSGERHCLRFRLRDCPDLHNRLAELPEHEFRLAGAIVADCCVTSKDPVLVQDVEGFYRAVDVDIELLTISDPQAEQPL